MRRRPLATRALLGATALQAGCLDADPYELRLHVTDAAQCEEYEPALVAAVDWWDDAGVGAFVYGGCVEDDFPTSVEFFQDFEAPTHTPDLEEAPDHNPVYVVDEIVADVGDETGARSKGEIAGASQHGLIPYCGSLVAVTSAWAPLIAHELGHQVLLDHHDDDTNVMSGGGLPMGIADVWISDGQIAEANEYFSECRRRTR